MADIQSKRIIICCDGTYDDFGDTPERTKPGSSVSRFLRWFLPPIVYHILWLLGLFSAWKRIEHWFRGPKTPIAGFQSNVSRLATAILPYSTEQNGGATVHRPQVVYYLGGIGALGTPQSRVEEAVTGNTMSYKVRYAYRFIVDNYSFGDEILLFGYSRGAFTVRALIGFIKWAGILKKENMDVFDILWDAYVKLPKAERSKERTEELNKFGTNYYSQKRQGKDVDIAGRSIDQPTYLDVNIKCLGIWDTVGSLGPPPFRVPATDNQQVVERSALRHGPFDIQIGPQVEHTFQALALDECRFDFYPAVLPLLSDNIQRGQVFSQTWFPGVHGDLGGNKSGFIGDYPYVWMVSKIEHYKLLDLDWKYITEQTLTPLLQHQHANPRWTSFGPRDWADRSWFAYHFLPSIFNIRQAIRNPHMPVNIGEAHDEMEAAVRPPLEEQSFHWTVLARINHVVNGRARYWDGQRYSQVDRFRKPLSWLRSQEASRSLRQRNPLEPDRVITKEMIHVNMDEAVGMDKDIKDFWESNGHSTD
ncbi:hypothetical protein BKA64DRAFT_579943 [Cadophora sp. MPI-SDFR-AT-0126]|nr:hypothetical protein BKA64DRAFT_579943 [Leotiomycetes sp. MPI-SDFR-AT-0126]